MARVNLTLDPDTAIRFERYAKQHHSRRATLARELLREALARREATERLRKLARDYAAGRSDQQALLEDLEQGQLEVLIDEGT